MYNNKAHALRGIFTRALFGIVNNVMLFEDEILPKVYTREPTCFVQAREKTRLKLVVTSLFYENKLTFFFFLLFFYFEVEYHNNIQHKYEDLYPLLYYHTILSSRRRRRR